MNYCLKKKFAKLVLLIMCISLLLQIVPTKAITYDEYIDIIKELENDKIEKVNERKNIEEKKNNLIVENEEIEKEILEYKDKILQNTENIKNLEKIKAQKEEKEEDIERYQMLLQSNYLLNTNISKEDIEDIKEIQMEIEKYKTSKNNTECYNYLTTIMQEYNENKQKEYQNHINLLQIKTIKYEKDIENCQIIITELNGEIESIENSIRKNKEEKIKVRVDSNEMNIDMIWPCPHTTRVTSGFGYRSGASTNYVGTTNHSGIDISANGIYGTPAIAVSDGIVEEAGWNGSMGNYVVVRHSLNVKTYYMHGSKITVSVGDYVEQGDEVLKIGSTGASTGAHLHFGVMVNGIFDNPWNWLE